jgi:hypothetical protein
MISEALWSGKNVVVLKMQHNGLPRKHLRFQDTVRRQWGVPVVEVSQLCDALERRSSPNSHTFLEEERRRIQEKLEHLF